jgi:hypothetical protein
MILERRFLPTQLDEAPFATLCQIDEILFIQVSHDQINWVPFSTALFEVKKYKLEDELYVQYIAQEYNKLTL